MNDDATRLLNDILGATDRGELSWTSHSFVPPAIPPDQFWAFMGVGPQRLLTGTFETSDGSRHPLTLLQKFEAGGDRYTLYIIRPDSLNIIEHKLPDDVDGMGDKALRQLWNAASKQIQQRQHQAA